MILELLNEMEEALCAKRPGLFQDLIRNGLLNSTILTHREIFLYFDKEKRLGNNVVKSVFKTSEQFKMCESNIYKIIKSMKE